MRFEKRPTDRAQISTRADDGREAQILHKHLEERHSANERREPSDQPSGCSRERLSHQHPDVEERKTSDDIVGSQTEHAKQHVRASCSRDPARVLHLRVERVRDLVGRIDLVDRIDCFGEWIMRRIRHQRQGEENRKREQPQREEIEWQVSVVEHNLRERVKDPSNSTLLAIRKAKQS